MREKYIFKLGESKDVTSLTFRKCVHAIYSLGVKIKIVWI